MRLRVATLLMTNQRRPFLMMTMMVLCIQIQFGAISQWSKCKAIEICFMHLSITCIDSRVWLMKINSQWSSHSCSSVFRVTVIPRYFGSRKIHLKFRDERSFELSGMSKICGQVTDTRASAGNKSSTTEGNCCNKGKTIHRKNKFFLFWKK